MFSDKMGFLTMMIGSFNLLNSHDVFCPNYFGLKAGASLINYIILLAPMNRELHVYSFKSFQELKNVTESMSGFFKMACRKLVEMKVLM